MKTILIPFLLLFYVTAFSQTNDVYIFGQSAQNQVAHFSSNPSWAAYLSRNLNGDVPIINHAPIGEYQVIVKFVIDTDGTVNNVEAVTNLGYGMEKEAIRVIRNSPKWAPEVKDGHNIITYRRQPVNFLVADTKISLDSVSFKMTTSDLTGAWEDAEPNGTISIYKFNNSNTACYIVTKQNKTDTSYWHYYLDTLTTPSTFHLISSKFNSRDYVVFIKKINANLFVMETKPDKNKVVLKWIWKRIE